MPAGEPPRGQYDAAARRNGGYFQRPRGAPSRVGANPVFGNYFGAGLGGRAQEEEIIEMEVDEEVEEEEEDYDQEDDDDEDVPNVGEEKESEESSDSSPSE